MKYVEVFNDVGVRVDYRRVPDSYEITTPNEYLGEEQDYQRFQKRHGPKEKLTAKEAEAMASAEKAMRELLSVEQLLARGDEVTEWLVKNIVVRKGITIIGGAPGCYKSFLAQHLALSVAHGEEWLEQFETKRGSVLYVDEENGDVLLAKRYKQLLAGHEQEAPTNLFSSIFQGLQLDKAEGEIHLTELVTFTQAKLVVIDSMVRCMDGEEDKSRDVRQVFETLKGVKEATGCSVVVLHHLRKGEGNRKGMNDLRGSGDFPAMADVIVLVTHNPVSRRVRLTMVKNRYINLAELRPWEVTVTNPLGAEESIRFTHSGIADEELSVAEEGLELLKEWVHENGVQEFSYGDVLSHLKSRGKTKYGVGQTLDLAQKEFFLVKLGKGHYKVAITEEVVG